MKKLVIMSLILTLAGCAYHMGPYKRELPGGYKKIFVKILENRSQEVGVEAEFTNALIEDLARSGVAQVSREADADVILGGVIYAISYRGQSAFSFETAPGQTGTQPRSLFGEYQTNVNVLFKLHDRQGKELWQSQIAGDRNYKAPQLKTMGLSTANPLYNQNARRQVLKLVAKDMATEVVSDMTEDY